MAMIFESRSLYKHPQVEDIYSVQIPKVVCQNMGLTKGVKVDIAYEDNKVVITKHEDK